MKTELDKLYEIFLKFPRVSTDTRNIEKNSLFFALSGENFDGNKFAEEAIQKGAAYAVVSDKNLVDDKRFIVVQDTLVALQSLAQLHRSKFEIPVIGITGSNGKTTTKELMKSALSEKYKVFATKGNLNNHIGVPLSLLSVTLEHEIAIIEMGANHQKEIEFLANISKPDCGLITNIGKAHLEGFGGIEGVEKGKTELFTNLNSRGKQVFINTSDARLSKHTESTNAITYGLESADYLCKTISNSPFLSIQVSYKENQYDINSQLIGTYNWNNIMSAVVIADYFGVKPIAIKNGIENYIPSNNRSQLLEQGSNKLILDCYNANPSSMKEAVENLVKSESDKKFFILGDMLELGEDARKEHEAIVDLLIDHELKGILVGKLFKSVKQNEFITFLNNEAAKKFLKTNPKKDTLFLIKGSRGIKLETIQEVL